MTHNPLIVPDSVTFEEAIALTQLLLAAMEQQQVSDAELEQTLTALTQQMNGARGFFVTYLTDDRPFADAPSGAVVRALQASAEPVSELLVKNLAMSTAMAIVHRRNHNEAMAQGSERVRARTAQLIHLTQLPQVRTKAQQLYDSAQTGTGIYQSFLERWRYDSEQRQAIQQAIADAVFDSLPS